MNDRLRELYTNVEDYLYANDMVTSARALPMIYEIMSRDGETEAGWQRQIKALEMCLETCLLLIEVHPDINHDEEDLLLTTVLLHIYPENIAIENLERKITRDLGFSQDVYEMIKLLLPDRNSSEEEMLAEYRKIQENRLTLLAALADRGVVIQHLHEQSTWNAHRFINDTRANVYPMAIYGKEHYHELLGPISILLEKMRSLLEVAEILLRRYELREAELIQDILNLREENATIRGIIADFESGKNN